MDFIQTFILAIVQGVTEFLPISSSAHTILTSQFLGWADQGVTFDLALNVGTLLAVVLYFRKDVSELARDTTLSLVRRQRVGTSAIGWYITFATIPVGLCGLLLKDHIDTIRENANLIAWIILFTTVFYAILLWAAEKYGKRIKPMKEMNLKNAIIIGAFQALALVPGTSRSGVTITAGLFLGYDFKTASRFSFLMAIPVISLATSLMLVKAATSSEFSVMWGDFFLGFAISFFTAMLAIHYFLKWLERFGMMPYVIYRFALAGVLLIFILAK